MICEERAWQDTELRKNKEIELKVKETICMIAGREDGHCDIDKVKVNYEERLYTPLREHRI